MTKRDDVSKKKEGTQSTRVDADLEEGLLDNLEDGDGGGGSGADDDGGKTSIAMQVRGEGTSGL